MFNTLFPDLDNRPTNEVELSKLVHSVEGGVAGVELDGGQSGLTHGESSGSSSVVQGGNSGIGQGGGERGSGVVVVVVGQGSGVGVRLVASVVEGREPGNLGGSLLHSGLLSVVNLEESGLGLNNGGGIDDRLGHVDGGNGEDSVVFGACCQLVWPLQAPFGR